MEQAKKESEYVKMKIKHISVLRVLAMLSIVVGHLLAFYHINTYQFGGIGVELFLLISGFLYGERAVPEGISCIKWLKKKTQRIMIPMWLWSIIVLASIFFITYEFETGVIPCFFGIQGLDFIFPFSLQIYPGLAHTWYLTVLLLFYPLVFFLNQKKVLSFLEKRYKGTLACVIILQIIFALFLQTQISYFVQLFIGFLIGKKMFKLENKSMTIITVLTFVLCVIRVFARKTIDGTALYDKVIARWTANLLMLIAFYCVQKLCNHHPEGTKKLVEGRLWSFFDSLSYEIYLTHYLFLKAVFSVSIVSNLVLIQIPIFIIATLISAFFLHFVSKKIISLLQKREMRKVH